MVDENEHLGLIVSGIEEEQKNIDQNMELAMEARWGIKTHFRLSLFIKIFSVRRVSGR